jgi:leucyl-tRNA synthetase
MLDGLATADAKKKMCAYLESKNLGRATVSYRLRDWVFSRQRYWGEPIPIVHCRTHGAVAIPESDLPVKLPEVERYEPTGTGESPLAGIAAWVQTKCPTCGGPAKRETNTMPQWAGSCWYYLRYLDAHNDQAAWSPDVEKQWQPVDLYVGGAEHAVLHLLYARFWHKVLFDLGFVSTPEPFKKLRHQGTVLAFSYQDATGHYHEPASVDLRGDEAFLKATGEKLKVSVEKMAKSMLNGINPDDVVAQYGADVLRLYEMFMGEFELPKPWDPRAIEGCARFLKRVWRLVEEWTADKAGDLDGNPERVPNPSHAMAAAGEAGLRLRDPHLRLRHKTIKKVSGDLERMAFNTAIAAMMEFVNELTAKGASSEDLLTLVKLVGPFAPHLGDEAWEMLGQKGYLIDAEWPGFEPALTVDAVVTLAIQVNGKMRGSLEVARDAAEEDIRNQALAVSNVVKHLEGKTVRKVIVVPGRIVNIVVG